MIQQSYVATLSGLTPLLQHQDNIEWADEMDRWKLDPENRATSVPGDDRSPPFRWIGCLYHDGQHVSLPADSIMATLREGGALVPTGRGQKTFKSQTQSGLAIAEPNWPLIVNEKAIPVQPFFDRRDTRTFSEYQKLAAAYGFSLHVKRAKVGMSKHVRVRPMFVRWMATGTIMVLDEQITEDILRMILTNAGKFKGLGDWRPGGRTPGTFGMFNADIELVNN